MLAKEPDTFWTDQFDNRMRVRGNGTSVVELLEQTGGRSTCSAARSAPGACYVGVSRALKAGGCRHASSHSTRGLHPP